MSQTLNFSRIFLVLVALLGASLACSLTNEENLEGGGKLVVDERPALVLLAPANQNDYLAGTKVTFHAQARDVGAGIVRIEFTVNVPGDPVKLIETTPNGEPQASLEAILEWTAVGNQTYLVEAVAYRSDGTPSNLEQLSIKIYDPNPPANNVPDAGDTGNTSSDDSQNTSTDTSSAEPVDIAIDAPAGVAGVIVGTDIQIRQGPDTSFQAVVTYSDGQAIEIVGRSADNLWYVIRVGEGFGWVFFQSVQADVAIETLPLVESPAQ